MTVTDRERVLEEEVAALRVRVAEVEALVAAKERELQRLAGDLRDTFRREHDRGGQLEASYKATVRALANAVEARDAYTGGHAERVSAYGLALAEGMGLQLSGRPEIEFGFLLHDIGKVAVPDAILYKPEPLSDAERRLMSRHPLTGVEILREVEFLGEAKVVVRSHHERWDGLGYPDGLVGAAIPVVARVFAVADAMDAITTHRPYRPASGIRDARRIIAAEAGRQFDPAVVEALARVPDDVLDAIRTRRR